VLGFQNEGRAAAERAMQESRSPRVVLQSASVLALAGDEARALKLPETLHCRGLSIPWFSMCSAGGKAIVELKRNQPAKAIDLLDGAMVYARADTGVLTRED